MIAFDTNVLVRILVQDDPNQSQQAVTLLQETLSQKQRIFLSQLVLCETVWVLMSCYQITKSRVVPMLTTLLHTMGFEFQDKDQILTALEQYQTGNGDFADYLIAQHAHQHECSHIVTFDRALRKQPFFVVL